MSQTDQTLEEPVQPADQDADGYYGDDDDVSSEELDLSFLDQDDDKPAPPSQK
jgi:hypothetical protein